MASSTQFLAQDVFSYLRPEQINAIHDASAIIELRAGEFVYRRGDKAASLFVVLDGQVALRLPGRKGFSILIETLGRGAMFGAGASLDVQNYHLTALCVADARLLKIDVARLRRLMEDDCRMGYTIQKRISDLYFKRYTETMQKMQDIVMSIPLETQ